MTDDPRLYRKNLIPAGAVGVPGPVVEANSRLRAAALAADEAPAARLEADRADRGAAQHDSGAAVAAAESGEETPAPTAAAKSAEFERAVEHESAAKQIARRAMLALGRTVVEHRDEWRAGQAPHVLDQGQAVLAAIDDLERELAPLAQGLGVLAALARDKPDVDHGVTFKPRTVGAAQRRPVDKQLAELRATIRAALPAPPPTEEELREREEHQARARRMRTMASSGLHVPGGAG